MILIIKIIIYYNGFYSFSGNRHLCIDWKAMFKVISMWKHTQINFILIMFFYNLKVFFTNFYLDIFSYKLSYRSVPKFRFEKSTRS